ncbi:hypothetical protein C0991_006589 [Blastosporella zonata]|nr:hypothetical protein C0991_006589 [Blastosporella zonata]
MWQAKLARAASHSSISNLSNSDDAIPLTLKVQAPNTTRPSYDSSSSSHDHDLRYNTNNQGYNTLYAPQPVKPPRQGQGYVYEQAHGHGHDRGSSDEVGWDLNSRTPMSLEPSAGSSQGVYGYQHAHHGRGAYQGNSAETLTGNESRDTLMQGQGQGQGQLGRVERGAGEGGGREFGHGMGHALEQRGAGKGEGNEFGHGMGHALEQRGAWERDGNVFGHGMGEERDGNEFGHGMGEPTGAPYRTVSEGLDKLEDVITCVTN